VARQKSHALTLVRPRAWWFTKVPLSVTLMVLLLDSLRVSVGVLATLAFVVRTVCVVGKLRLRVQRAFDVEDAD
jgi:hypothetical protein